MAARTTTLANAQPGAPAPTPPAASAPPDAASARFREVMSHLASGVVLVTASVGGRPWGMTVSAACPICIEPPTMLVSLETRTALAQAVGATGRFGVNILGECALRVARFGSTIGQPKFLDDGLGVELGDRHAAEVMLDGALGHIDCEVVNQVAHGTHSIFLGRVREIGVHDDAPLPLVHYRRGFWKLGKAA
jgi:flavin reductase ActVB